MNKFFHGVYKAQKNNFIKVIILIIIYYSYIYKVIIILIVCFKLKILILKQSFINVL